MKKQKVTETKFARIEFITKICPTCKEVLSVRKLGIWGYYCDNCLYWWGTYDPWPKVTNEPPNK